MNTFRGKGRICTANIESSVDRTTSGSQLKVWRCARQFYLYSPRQWSVLSASSPLQTESLHRRRRCSFAMFSGVTSSSSYGGPCNNTTIHKARRFSAQVRVRKNSSNLQLNAKIFVMEILRVLRWSSEARLDLAPSNDELIEASCTHILFKCK